MNPDSGTNSPQIKICGLTTVAAAVKCAALGADAIGFVFFPKSPRNLSEKAALSITAELPATVCKVGVFVNETADHILRCMEACRLDAAQLHGKEPPETIDLLAAKGIKVIKGLYLNGTPSVTEVDQYRSPAFLVECSAGKLPGGNAKTWDWGAAREFGQQHPLILAGGLSPENVADAIAAAEPDAVDVSSGVESAPGRKDLVKVEAFINAVHRTRVSRPLRRLFDR